MSEELITLLVRSAIVIFSMMMIVWLESVRRKDASIVDLSWGLGFVVVAWASFLSADSSSTSAIVLLALTTVWGLRLSIYLAWRNHGKPEDFRYQAMREKWGDSFPIVSLLTVFGIQGIVMWIVSLPIQTGIALGDRNGAWLFVAGVATWTIGILFESIGDWQLARFKSNAANINQVLDTGLWRYTRHPNYFGDFAVWWGLFLMSVSTSGVWWTVIGPIVMSIFLMKVSGVTLLESSLVRTKSGYAAYVSRTNAFFPGPPRRSAP